MCMCGIACSYKSATAIFYLFLWLCCHHTKLSQQLCVLGLPSPTRMGTTELVRSTDPKEIQVPLDHKELGTTHCGATVLSFSCFSKAHKCWGYGVPLGFGWEQSPGPQWSESRKPELKADGSAGFLSLPWGHEVVCSKLGILILARHQTKPLYFESSMEPWKILHVLALYH